MDCLTRHDRTLSTLMPGSHPISALVGAMPLPN
jgi:hypothetical protein